MTPNESDGLSLYVAQIRSRVSGYRGLLAATALAMAVRNVWQVILIEHLDCLSFRRFEVPRLGLLQQRRAISCPPIIPEQEAA
jgi:hypothetical protein